MKPVCWKQGNSFFENYSKANMRRISLCSDIDQRRTSDLPEDVKDQVITEMKTSIPMLFVDESTEVASCPQLLVFMTRIHSGDILSSCFVRNCTLQQVQDVPEK